MHMQKGHLYGFLVASALVLTVGVWQSQRLGHARDTQEREALLIRAAMIAQTISGAPCHLLSFTSSDSALPVFQTLRLQLAAAAEHLNILGLFMIAQRDGQFFFGPESYPENHPNASPPGTPYRLPPPEVALSFATRQPQLTHLYTDEYDTFVSAFVPVIDPHTGNVLMLVGADLDAKLWRQHIFYARLIPLLFTLLLLILLGVGFAILANRPRFPSAFRWKLRYAEAALCAVVMLALTVAAIWRTGLAERHGRSDSFASLAHQQALSIVHELDNTREKFDDLTRMCLAKHTVDAEDFHHYASSVDPKRAIQGVAWLPAVPASDVARFEADARAAGSEAYRVWQFDQQGARIPAQGRETFYPVLYRSPATCREFGIGFDLSSESVRAAALYSAVRRAGQPVTTEPLTLFAATNQPSGFLAFQAATSNSQTSLVAMAVSITALVTAPMKRVGYPDYGLTADLFLLKAGATPKLLATSDPSHTPESLCWNRPTFTLPVRVPVFCFGNVYAVVIHTSPAWLAANPLRESWATGVAGLFFTLLMTAFVAHLSNRRIALEREVHSRTADLQTAHDNMRGILDAAPMAMMVVDREAKILSTNQRAAQLFHSKVSECLNHGCGTFLRCFKRHEDERGCGYGSDCADCPLRCAIREVFDGAPNIYDRDMETLVDHDGKPENFRLQFSVAPVIFNNRRQIIVAVHDITAWYRTEQIYQTLFTEMHYGFALQELIIGGHPNPIDFEYQTANPAFERLTGIPVSTLSKKTILTTFPDFPPDLIATYAKVAQTGEACRFTFFAPNLAKHFEGTLFRSGPGQVASIFTDVTDRKQAEDKARASADETRRLLDETKAAQHDLLVAVEEQKRADEALIHERNLLYALMDNLPDRIYFKDTESRFIKISKAHAASLGLESPAEAIGKTDADFKPADEAERARSKEREIILTGQPLLAQVEQKRTADGRIRWVSASKAPIRDSQGRVVGLVGISRDITHEIELQQQLQQASKMDAIGRLAGGVAHDFNNLLQAILGFTEILISGVGEKDPQYDDLKEIERAAKRAADLTRQLLAFSRKQRIEPQTLDINHIISDTEKMLHRLVGEDIEIVQLLDPMAKPVLADPNQIEQIIMNLAVNARDAMPQGGRLTFSTETVEMRPVDVTMIPESHTGVFTCLSVSDTGSGINPELLPHLFEPFFTTKGQGKGTGLGLSVIYGIVKQNDGWINAYSQEGQGSTFKVYLPASQKAVAQTEVPPPPDTLPGLGKAILLVEDEPGVRSLATLVLQSAGFKVTACENAEVAVTVFSRTPNRFDLLFSDVVLPGKNGIELAITLRGLAPNLPVLLCSGYADDRVRWASIEQEGFRFINKPYPTATLLRAVHETLHAAKTPHA